MNMSWENEFEGRAVLKVLVSKQNSSMFTLKPPNQQPWVFPYVLSCSRIICISQWSGDWQPQPPFIKVQHKNAGLFLILWTYLCKDSKWQKWVVLKKCLNGYTAHIECHSKESAQEVTLNLLKTRQDKTHSPLSLPPWFLVFCMHGFLKIYFMYEHSIDCPLHLPSLYFVKIRPTNLATHHKIANK